MDLVYGLGICMFPRGRMLSSARRFDLLPLCRGAQRAPAADRLLSFRTVGAGPRPARHVGRGLAPAAPVYIRSVGADVLIGPLFPAFPFCRGGPVWPPGALNPKPVYGDIACAPPTTPPLLSLLKIRGKIFSTFSGGYASAASTPNISKDGTPMDTYFAGQFDIAVIGAGHGTRQSRDGALRR